MNPRKKSKPNPQAPANNANVEPQAGTDPSKLPLGRQEAATHQNVPETMAITEVDSTLDEAGTNAGTARSTQSSNKKATRKWLGGGGGSWRSKAPAIVKTAKESIGVAGGATSELPGEDAQKPSDESPKKFLTKRKSSKGNAIPASMTKLNISSDGAIG